MIEYMESRIALLKTLRDKYTQDDISYCSYDAVISELKFTIALFTKETVNNTSSSSIIEAQINKTKLV
jgi:hypothetical protein